MTDKIIDLTHSLESANSGQKSPPQKVTIETLRKFDVNFEEISKEVNILDFETVQTQEKDTNSIFGEFDSVSYRIQFVTYNVEFLLRMLTFHNDAQSQILKLDIQIKTTTLLKEFEYCRNWLQRRRNLNLMFRTLITFSRFIEGRRLICDLILKKNRNIQIEQNKEGGIIIVYSNDKRNVRLGIFWSIACNSTNDITDIIEVYYKFVESSFPNKNEIEFKLNSLTEPCLEFTKKFHLWRSLIDNLSGRTLSIVIDKMPDRLTNLQRSSKETQNIEFTLSHLERSSGLEKISEGSRRKVSSRYTKSTDKQDAQNITVLSDSEESSQKSVQVDKVYEDSTRNVLSLCPNNDKEREIQCITVLSDSEETSQKSLVVGADKMSEDSTKTVLLPCSNNNTEKEVQNETVLSDSEESSQKSSVTEVHKMSADSTEKISSSCAHSSDRQEIQNVTLLSGSKESPKKCLVVEIDNMPVGPTNKASHHDKEEKEETVISSSTKSSKKSLIVKVAKLQNTPSTTGTLRSQKNIIKAGVLSSENKQSSDDEESSNVNESSDDEESSEDKDVKESEDDKDLSSRKSPRLANILSGSSSQKPTAKTTKVPIEVLSYLQLKKVGSKKNIETSLAKSRTSRSKFTKNKVVELESSDSEFRSRQLPPKIQKTKKRKDDSISDKDCTISESYKAVSRLGRKPSKNSKNRKNIRSNASEFSSSDDDKYPLKDEDVKESEDDKDLLSRKPQTIANILSGSSSQKPTARTTKVPMEVLSYLQLKKVGSKFTKNKVVELESSDCSDSEFMLRKLPPKIRKRKKHKYDSSSDKDYHSKNRQHVSLNASEFSSSGDDDDDDDDDEYSPKKFFDIDNELKTKMIQVPEKLKKKKILLYPSRKSPRVNSTVDIDTPLRPSAHSALLNPRRSLRSESKNKPVQSPIVTSSPTKNDAKPMPSRGLVLVTDHKTLNSVLPNDLLNIIDPRKSETPSKPERNVRIRLIPESPLNRTPSFLELNLFTPSKKARFEPKIIDDDLEITSVTYLVPD